MNVFGAKKMKNMSELTMERAAGAAPLGAGATLAWLNPYRRLSVRYERRADLHDEFLYLG